jgi:pimeloyl-ACP methyl ester carboxylesterase
MDTVDLAHRDLGGPEGAPPLLLLHGLMGSARNWQGAGKRLARWFRVTALDLRNHGDSPHSRRMDYPSMAADVLAWMDRAGIGRAHMLGHSMGGKVAMYLACRYTERFPTLTVADIAPRAYPPRWEREFALMRRMPVARFSTRREAEEWLEDDISDWAFRKFIVSNLERCEAGGFSWILNLEVLEAALPNLFVQVPANGEGYAGPTRFIRGAQSRFIRDEDLPMMRRHFPACGLVTIEQAGHNVHFDQPEAFAEAVRQHLQESGNPAA